MTFWRKPEIVISCKKYSNNLSLQLWKVIFTVTYIWATNNTATWWPPSIHLKCNKPTCLYYKYNPNLFISYICFISVFTEHLQSCVTKQVHSHSYFMSYFIYINRIIPITLGHSKRISFMLVLTSNFSMQKSYVSLRKHLDTVAMLTDMLA